MKRFLLILLLAAVSPNLFGSVRPFNTKIVKDTEFPLAEDINVEKTVYTISLTYPFTWRARD